MAHFPSLPRFVANTLKNVVYDRLNLPERAAQHPVDCCYQMSWGCNLNCVYCYENSRALRPTETRTELDTAGVIATLAGIRKATDAILLSGGEPTLRHDIAEIIATCRQLDFKMIMLNTNLVRRPPSFAFLEDVHLVMAGVDTMTEDGFVRIARGTPEQFHDQMANLDEVLRLRDLHQFDVCISAVIVPGHVAEAERVFDWCCGRQLLVAFSPQVRDFQVHPDLRTDPAFRRFTERLADAREDGLPLLGAPAYYRGIRDLTPFKCHPMINLTVTPQGEMRWPCGEATTTGPSFVDGKPYPAMIAEARARHGSAPQCIDRCHFGCRLALSSLINHPSELFGDALHTRRFMRHQA